VFSHLPLKIFLTRPEKVQKNDRPTDENGRRLYYVYYSFHLFIFIVFLMLFLLGLLCVYLPPMMMKITIRLVNLAIIATISLTSSASVKKNQLINSNTPVKYKMLICLE